MLKGRISQLFAAIIFLLPVSLSAANIKYLVIDQLNNQVFGLVAPNFLTSFPATSTFRGLGSWRLVPPQLLVSPCGPAPLGLNCVGISMSQASSVQTSVTIVTRDSNGQLSDYFTGVPGGVPVFQVAINQLGTGASIGGGLYTLTISTTDLPVTYAPEPSTLFLLLSGLAVSMLLYAKRFLAARN